jgi:hypothetical protein
VIGVVLSDGAAGPVVACVRGELGARSSDGRAAIVPYRRNPHPKNAERSAG